MPEQVKSKVSSLAIAALVCALLGLILGIIPAVIGFILGLVALRKIKRSQAVLSGRGIAIAAVIIAVAGTVLRLLIVMPAFYKTKGRAAVASTLGNMSGIRISVEMYKSENGSYPKDLSVLVLDSGKGAYLKKLPKDAWGRDYIYRVKSDESFELFSLGPDGKEGSKDDVKLGNS